MSLGARGAARKRAAERWGRLAELAAVLLLTLKGYRVLARRVRTPVGEIDLIARRGPVLAFVEVKARPSLAEAAHALSPRQRAGLVAAAKCWLAENPGHGAAGIRFDVLLVAADGTVRRVADAFRLGDG